jgi:lysyl-tRNA synthetase class 2
MSRWQTQAPIGNLKARGQILATIRQHFAEQNVLEVDAAVMSHCAVSDPFIDSIETVYQPFAGGEEQRLYLQTSPEYAMKRLLASGSGDIYQMGKVFRNGESGRIHNPEFTMLEWYRLGFDDQSLMDDVEALVCKVLSIGSIRRERYQILMQEKTGLDPIEDETAKLKAYVLDRLDVVMDDDDRDGWLNLIMSHFVEPALVDEPVFVTDYPASQSALAKVRPDSTGLMAAARFELFVGGMELANGYHELTDAKEQKRRLEADLNQRKALGLPERPFEHRLVAALESGMPECAGVALGVDRLVMLALNANHIAEVIPFVFADA